MQWNCFGWGDWTMKPIRPFEDFIKEGIVKKQSPDKSRAKSLVEESEKARIFLAEVVREIGVNNENANQIIKNCYDIIMEMLRAKMLMEGYNSSGIGAHEAEVSYLRKLNFNEIDIQFINQLRYFRNGILYYGKIFDKEYAEKVLHFLEKVHSSLKQMLKS